MRRDLVLVCLIGLAASAPIAFTSAAPAGNQVYTDRAATDADFPFQGEYEGVVKHDSGEAKFGVQVVALGDGKFDAVAYPGGLPGAGWTPPTRSRGAACARARS